jgi:hypothetical protein
MVHKMAALQDPFLSICPDFQVKGFGSARSRGRVRGRLVRRGRRRPCGTFKSSG